MRYLGMTALGVFIGTLVTMATRRITDWTKLETTLGILASVAVSGGLLPIINLIGPDRVGDAIFFYPVGLVVGLVWLYADVALESIQASERSARQLRWLHIAAMTAVTFLVLLLLFSPEIRALLPA